MIFFLLILLTLSMAILQKKHVDLHLIQINVIHASAPMLMVALIISYCLNTYAHKSIVANAVTNQFIYQFLLPIIVLAEGFNNRKKSLGFYRREILSFGVLMPVMCFFVFGGLLLGIQYIFVDKLKMFTDLK